MPASRFLALALAVFLAAGAFAAVPGLRFERLTVDDGLPDGQIHALFQDHRGFLWISTRNGLGRYDGREFVLHRYDPNDERSINGNWVGPVLEDPRGRLWISLGVGGLDRFDPRTGVFEHLDLTPRTPETSDFSIGDLALEPSGTVWVGTTAHGLFRLENGEIGEPLRLHAGADAESLSLAHDNVSDLAIDEDGNLWIATCGGGLALRLREASEHDDPPDGPRLLTLRASGGLSSDCPRVILPDELGAWVGSAAGVDRVLLASWPGEEAELRVEPFAADGPAGSVGHLALDGRARLWAGFDGVGFGVLTPSTGSWRFFPFAEPVGLLRPGGAPTTSANSVSFLQADAENRIWTATLASGLYVYDPESDTVEHFVHDPADPLSLSGDALSTALFDRGRGLWLGTAGRGLSFYSPWRFKFDGVRWDPLGREGLTHPYVLSLDVDGDQLFVGTAGGLERYDLASGEVEALSIPQLTSAVTALEIDDDGDVFIGTALTGLFRLTPESGEIRAYPSRPGDVTTPSSQAYTCLRLAHDRRSLWLGTSQGFLDRLDLETGRVERQVFTMRVPDGRQSSIWAIEPQGERTLWLGAPSLGLFRLDLESGEAERFESATGDPGSINNKTVNSLLLDSRQRLWVGTFSGGLDRFDEATTSFTHLTERDGLPSNMVEAILEQPAGVVWLATRHGLARYDPGGSPGGSDPGRHDSEKGRLEKFFRRDGLVADGFSTGAAARTPDGRLFFGGLGGVVSFRPGEISSNPHRPPVALTRFYRQGAAGRRERALDGVREVRVLPGDRVFGFDFAALDFADPERNRFAYRLEGFDDAWIDAGTKASASYTNIDPGRYVFRVRGSNADGLWNLDGASVRVRVEPSFWQTGWFRLLEIALAMAALGLVFLWQRRRLLARERRERERLEHERKSRELEIARRMQRALLPREDFSHPAIQIAGRHRTASEVGGDYFDIIETRGGALCLAVGDAVGHGMAAGFVVGMVKAGLLNALRQDQRAPAELLIDLDAMLRSAAPAGGSSARLVSMGLAIALLDLDSRRLELSSVAMPYPYLWRHASGTLTALELGGLPLGRRLGQQPRRQDLRLEDGDALIFVSDGLVERRGDDEQPWGFEALEAALAALSAEGILHPATLCDALLAACDRWAGGREADDDMTVLVILARPTLENESKIQNPGPE